AERAQGGADGVEAGPVARGAADAAVHHQVLRSLGHVRIEVVLQHPVRRLGEPAAAVQGGAARRADLAGRVVAGAGHGNSRKTCECSRKVCAGGAGPASRAPATAGGNRPTRGAVAPGTRPQYTVYT